MGVIYRSHYVLMLGPAICDVCIQLLYFWLTPLIMLLYSYRTVTPSFQNCCTAPACRALVECGTLHAGKPCLAACGAIFIERRPHYDSCITRAALQLRVPCGCTRQPVMLVLAHQRRLFNTRLLILLQYVEQRPSKDLQQLGVTVVARQRRSCTSM